MASHVSSLSIPTASDFTDLGTDITNLTDDKVSKPSDWSAMNNPTGLVPETELNPYSLDSYVYNKVRRQNKLDKETFLDLGKVGDNTQVNINSKHVKITSDGVNIGTNATPDTGYKFQVEGDIKMKNGTNKYLDMSTGRVGVRGDADHLLDGCDIKLYGDTCVTGDLMVSGTLTNGSGVSYATTNDIASFATTSSVSTLSTALSTLQTSVGTNSSSLASKASSADVYTQQHINDNFQTVAPSGKSYAFDTDLTNFITASALSNFITSSDLPDVSSFITNSTTSLANYDTSSTISTNHYTKTETDALIPSSSSPTSLTEVNGNIGINTSSPLAKLHVNGSKSSYLNRSTVGVYAWWYGAGLSRGPLGNQNYNLSIYATNEIATNRAFFSTQGAWSASDARIKRDIEDINDSEALIQLRQLHPKKYGYKDVGERGTGKVIGFIADEVEEVIPEAITKTEWGIPSILEVSNVIGSNVISFTNFSTSNLDSNATALECLDVFGEEHFITIAKVIDEKTIQVEEDLSNWTGSFNETGNLVVNTTTAKLTLEEYDALEPDEQNGYVDEGDVYVKTITSYPGNNLFIRGERVSNFRTLKKEMLFAINFSATQELDRQLQAEKDKVASLEARIFALENN